MTLIHNASGCVSQSYSRSIIAEQREARLCVCVSSRDEMFMPKCLTGFRFHTSGGYLALFVGEKPNSGSFYSNIELFAFREYDFDLHDTTLLAQLM